MSEVEIIEQEQTYKPNTTNTELPTDNINQGSVAIESARARAEAQSKLLLAASRPRNEARCIDKMIEAFYLVVVDTTLGCTMEEFKSISNRIDEGLNLFAKYYLSLWD